MKSFFSADTMFKFKSVEKRVSWKHSTKKTVSLHAAWEKSGTAKKNDYSSAF